MKKIDINAKGPGNRPNFPRDKYTREERYEAARQVQLAQKVNDLGGQHGNKNTFKNLNATGYFARPNVKEFQTRLATHMLSDEVLSRRGRGTFFDNVEDLKREILDYITLCQETETVPLISSLCCWLGCDRGTLYNHANNPNSPAFHECRTIIEYCHSCLESGASESKLNSVAYIFQAKNYFGMKDQTEVTLSANQQSISNSVETLDALKEQIGKEKQIDMREAEYKELVPIDVMKSTTKSKKSKSKK